MLKYIGKRLLIAIPTFLGITILVYALSAMVSRFAQNVTELRAKRN